MCPDRLDEAVTCCHLLETGGMRLFHRKEMCYWPSTELVCWTWRTTRQFASSRPQLPNHVECSTCYRCAPVTATAAATRIRRRRLTGQPSISGRRGRIGFHCRRKYYKILVLCMQRSFKPQFNSLMHKRRRIEWSMSSWISVRIYKRLYIAIGLLLNGLLQFISWLSVAYSCACAWWTTFILTTLRQWNVTENDPRTN
jgi:hypothetical protein